MMKILLYMTFLIILMMIGVYDWIYGMRVKKVRMQIGLELPRISIVLLRISVYFIVISFFTIVTLALIAR